jgi:hypothetical protein
MMGSSSKIRYVDFDGTLAKYDGWKGPEHLGEPIPLMIKRAQNFLADGDQVVVFTARMNTNGNYGIQNFDKMRKDIEDWCLLHVGQKLQVTNEKGPLDDMYDDRAFRIVRNTGLTTEEFLDSIIQDELRSDRTKEQSLQRVLQVISSIQQEQQD